MELKDILSISGKPGLYKFISQGRNSIIVESLTDNKRISASASMKISSMEDIAVYTDEGEEPLYKVFARMMEKHEGKEAINHKASAGELKIYFEEILPTYDAERVYNSDIKKIITWYNQLVKFGVMQELIENQEKKEKEEEESEKENAKEDETGQPTEEKEK